MKHELNLLPNPFNMIKAGIKTIEMRLNDEKRSFIKIGDLIEFENKETHEKITCEVLALHKFKSFDELYKNFDKSKLGYLPNEEANPNDMHFLFSRKNRPLWSPWNRD